MAADPYTTLGVSRGASEKDIKSAYRKLAKELHPDTNKDNPKAADRFSDVTRAYDLLSDKAKRAQFDRGEIDVDGNPTGPFGGGGGFAGGGFGGGPGGQRGFGGGFSGGSDDGIDLEDLFGGIFGGGARGGPGGMGGMGGRGRAPRGANVSYRLAVPLTDAAELKPQRITLSDGKTIDLKLPAGVEDGTQMRLSGKGEAGPGGAGDAIVTIQIQPHPYFRQEGDDLRIDLPITLDEALAGSKVKAPTPSGAVMLSVPVGASSGKVLRLKGRGMSRKDGTRGDQLISLQIALPEPDSEAGADLASRLEGWSDGRDVRGKLGI